MGLTIPTSDTRHPHHSLIIYSRHLQNLLRKLPSHPDLNPLLTSLTNFHRSQWFRSALTLVKSVKRKREEEEEEEPVQEEEAPPAQEEEAAEEAEQEESTDSDTDVFDWNAFRALHRRPHVRRRLRHRSTTDSQPDAIPSVAFYPLPLAPITFPPRQQSLRANLTAHPPLNTEGTTDPPRSQPLFRPVIAHLPHPPLNTEGTTDPPRLQPLFRPLIAHLPHSPLNTEGTTDPPRLQPLFQPLIAHLPHSPLNTEGTTDPPRLQPLFQPLIAHLPHPPLNTEGTTDPPRSQPLFRPFSDDTILRSVLRRHYTLYPPTPPDSDQSPTGITADSALSRGAWRASWVFPNAAGHETDSDEAPEYLRNVGADGEGERDGDGNSDGDGENEPRYEEGPVVFSGEWIGPGN